jgi:hypothetical protein
VLAQIKEVSVAPTGRLVKGAFGSWNEGLEAAGLPPAGRATGFRA